MPDSPLQKLQKILTDLRKARHDGAAFDKLSSELEVFVRAYLMPAEDATFTPYKLTNRERRICDVLRAKEGQIVPKQQIYDAAFFDEEPENWPESNAIHSHICRARAKLKGTGHVIDTFFAVGFRYRFDRSLVQ